MVRRRIMFACSREQPSRCFSESSAFHLSTIRHDAPICWARVMGSPTAAARRALPAKSSSEGAATARADGKGMRGTHVQAHSLPCARSRASHRSGGHSGSHDRNRSASPGVLPRRSAAHSSRKRRGSHLAGDEARATAVTVHPRASMCTQRDGRSSFAPIRSRQLPSTDTVAISHRGCRDECPAKPAHEDGRYPRYRWTRETP